MSGAEIQEVPDGFLVVCPEHNLLRGVETSQHAANLQALHNRRDHADDTDSIEVDLTAAARVVVDLNRSLRQYPGDPRQSGSTAQKKAQGRLGGGLLIWEALTGLHGRTGIAYAEELATTDPPITASIPPF